jgi:hypothetical protein
MVTIAPRLVRFGAFLLLSAPLSLSSGRALADLTSCATGSVCYYVAIQPIDVCTSTGTGCAPFNTSSKTGNPGAATSTTPIGFVDTATGKDITRAIMNQIGVDVAWSPIKQYNNTTYQTLHIVQCSTTTLPCATSNPNPLTSTDFLTLSQQNAISQGTVPNPTPPNAPVSLQPTVVNMFFVNSLAPPPGQSGTLYGFSWIGNNGIAISSSAFFPLFPLTPRYDTLAHELGHDLGLDHADQFNLNAPKTDVMTTGVSRAEPATTSAAIADITSGSASYGTADQFNTSAAPTQKTGVAVSGFLNPIASSTTNVTTPSNGTITTALVVSDTAGDMTTITAAPNSTKPNTSIYFDVLGPTSGRDGETLIGLIVTLGTGLHFDPTNKIQLKNNGGLVTSVTYDHGNTGDANCPDPATQCLVMQLNPGLAASPAFLEFWQGIVGAPGQVGSSGKTLTLDNLAAGGVNITYKFSDGLIITGALTGSSAQGYLTGDSQHPTSTVPTQVDPNLFRSVVGAPPCTPTVSFDGTDEIIGACPDPYVTGVSDGNPADEAQPSNGD